MCHFSHHILKKYLFYATGLIIYLCYEVTKFMIMKIFVQYLFCLYWQFISTSLWQHFSTWFLSTTVINKLFCALHDGSGSVMHRTLPYMLKCFLGSHRTGLKVFQTIQSWHLNYILLECSFASSRIIVVNGWGDILWDSYGGSMKLNKFPGRMVFSFSNFFCFDTGSQK